MAFEEGVTFNMSLMGFESMTKTVLDANFISWGLSTGSHREQGHFTSAVINIIITFQLLRSEPQMFGHWKNGNLQWNLDITKGLAKFVRYNEVLSY